jgi:hypothetical protein
MQKLGISMVALTVLFLVTSVCDFAHFTFSVRVDCSEFAVTRGGSAMAIHRHLVSCVMNVQTLHGIIKTFTV